MPIEKLHFKEYVSGNHSNWDVINLYLHNLDIPVREISKRTGRSIGEIYRIVRQIGYSPNRQILNHNNVRTFSQSGLPVSKIAELTGYTPRNVRYVLKRENNGINSK